MMIKRFYLTILISFFTLLSITLLFYLKNSSEKEVLSKLEKMNYYDYIHNDLISKLEAELPNPKLSYIYSDYITKDRLKNDVKTVLNNFYLKENDNIKKEFYTHVFEKINKEDDENIKSLTDNLANIYYNNLFRIDKLDLITSRLPANNTAKSLAIFSLCITVLLIIKTRNQFCFYNSFIINGVIFILPKLFINFKNILKDFYYYNDSLSYFIKMYSYDIIDEIFIYGITLLIIGFIGLIFKIMLTKNVK